MSPEQAKIVADVLRQNHETDMTVAALAGSDGLSIKVTEADFAEFARRGVSKTTVRESAEFGEGAAEFAVDTIDFDALSKLAERAGDGMIRAKKK